MKKAVFFFKLLITSKHIKKIPFGILYYSGITEAEIKFDKPVSLDNLIISFKDLNNFPINFYNLKHSLDLQISVSE